MNPLRAGMYTSNVYYIDLHYAYVETRIFLSSHLLQRHREQNSRETMFAGGQVMRDVA
jgi:hypothetical protein